MKPNKEFKKLDKKLRKGKEFQSKRKVNIIHGDRLQRVVVKQMSSEENKKKKTQMLYFLELLLKMIKEGATGFDLAYEIEKNQEVKHLIYDGILFYNTFLEIGNKKFIEVPDKIIENYKSFKTVEDTEKYIFMVWLNEQISLLKKKTNLKEDYAKYIESKRAEERKETEKKLLDKLANCKNCGAKIKSIDQEYCEECGVNLME